MVIDSGSISNILRTYNKQLKYGRISAIVDKPSSTDKLELSPEAKKAMFISRLISETDKELNMVKINKKLSEYNFSEMTEEELNNLRDEILKTL
ncbi:MULTISPECIES: hypothetical protein [Calditerrivibrio]|jgi:hypothetical protein|uniref:hypothetical protein n=1 Tax=Calditerrivibrio TaxID=545865 RepID=UPI003C78A934